MNKNVNETKVVAMQKVEPFVPTIKASDCKCFADVIFNANVIDREAVVKEHFETMIANAFELASTKLVLPTEEASYIEDLKIAVATFVKLRDAESVNQLDAMNAACYELAAYQYVIAELAKTKGNAALSKQIVAIVKDKDIGAVKAFAEKSDNLMSVVARRSDNPMLEAVKLLQYPVLKVTVKDDKALYGSVLSCSVEFQVFEPTKFTDEAQYLGKVNKTWLLYTMRLNQLLTFKVARDVGGDALEKFVEGHAYVRDEARKIDLGQDPTSNRNMLRVLNEILKLMIGEGYKALSYDVRYLKIAHATVKTQKEIKVKDSKGFAREIVIVANRVVYGSDYTVTGYDTKKR